MNLEQDLNPQQLEAVKHTEGPLLIFAGAGSGKTRVITYRIAYLLAKGIPGRNILGLTFTNKAAETMRTRVNRLAGGAARDVFLGTFHAFAAVLLRAEIGRLGWPSSFSIYDEDDQKTVLKECITEAHLDDKQYRPGMLAYRISRAKDDLIDPDSYAIYAAAGKSGYDLPIADVYVRYQKHLHRNHALDFGDLLMYTETLFRDHPDLLEKYQERFRYILVDEYQDTNHAQYMMIRRLAAKYRNLCVCGDDDQGIYGWRGADIRNILSFEKDYPDTKIVKVEQNYRSTPQILEKAWRVVKNNQFRADKKLWTERPAGPPPIAREFPTDLEEASAIAAEIRRLQEEQGISLREVAVFYRTNAQSRLFEEALRRQNLPHVVVGSVRFYSRAEIKDVVAYMRLIVNREDEFSLRRIVNAPARGIGKTTLQDLERFAHDKAISLWDALARVRELGLGPKTTGAVEKFRSMIVTLSEQKPALRPAVFAARVLETTGYVADLESEGTWESEQRLENLQEFIAAVEEFEEREPGAGLENFLEQVALMSGIDRWSTEAEAVTLMTVHLSKGLEFGTVFMVGMEEGLFPHGEANFSDEELEEERRLCYVGMTRAKDRLCLTSAQSRRLRGSSRWTLTSRFVEEAGLTPAPPRVGAFSLPTATTGGAAGPPDEPSPPAVSASAPPSSSGAAPPPYSVGDRVVHPEFGGGVVTLVSGTGDDVKVTVQFDDGRWRKLMLRYAPLTPEP